MRRALYVLAGSGVSLAGILSFQSTPVQLKIVATQTSVITPSTPSKGPTTTAGVTVSTTSSNPQPTTTAFPATTALTTTTTAAAGTTAGTGPSVNYYFGSLSVSVKAIGHKITNVTIASINDGGNGRSIAIDQYAIPILERQAIAAQSANIQGVTGASYTSAGFKQSLQAALQKLGI